MNKKSTFAKASADKPIIIIGGGPTGLAAAYRLSQLGRPFILIEREKHLGGLSATLKHKDFLYEFGPHAFHLKDPQITQWLKNLLGKDFRVIPTNTHVLIEGQIFNYPLKAGELLRKIRFSLGLKIFLEYMVTYFKNIFRQNNPQNFEEWGLKNFGPTLYKISFGDYTKKVWGINPRLLSAKLASQKLARLNLADIIVKLLGFKGQEQPAYFRQYLYPKEGIELIFRKMLQKMPKESQILLGCQVKKLENARGNIQNLEYQDSSGKIKKMSAGQIISTITVKDLAKMINHPVGKNVLEASAKLKYRDLIIVYLTTSEKNPLFLSQWIYLVEKDKFQFNRLNISKNLSAFFAPPDQTVLSLEICCQKKDELWQKKDEDLAKMAKNDLEKLNLDPTKISSFFVKRIENAYPIYLKNFETNVKNVFLKLGKINNLISTGRNGLYLNSDIHDCFKMGFEAAEKVEQNLGSKTWYEKEGLKWLNQ